MCLHPRTYNGIKCPCGVCEECIKQKANSTMQVLVDCASRYPTFHFLTFTYHNDKVPLFVRRRNIFYTRKDFKYKYQYEKYMREVQGCRPNKRMESQLRKEYNFLRADHAVTPDTIQSMTYEGEDYIVAPSLCRDEVQKTLKLFRQYYDRKYQESGDEGLLYMCKKYKRHNEPLELEDGTITTVYDYYHHKFLDSCDPKYKLNFKFYIRGEYGTQTARPHYHGNFYGLTTEQVYKLVELWEKHYGRVVVKDVARTQKDFMNVSRYISNYINKAMFEPLCVKEYVCERPRVQCSIGMVQLTEREMMYYSGLDDVIPSKYEAYYSWDDLDRIYRRLKRTVGTKTYKLSDKYKKRIFYDKVTEIDFWTGEKKTRLIATPLQNAITMFVQCRHNDDVARELDEVLSEVQTVEDRVEALRYYDSRRQDSKQARERLAVCGLRQNVRKDSF